MPPGKAVLVSPIAESSLARDDMAVQDLACVAHVHSTFSDGTATVPEIAAAARAGGAACVLLTDHDSRAAARAGFEGWHDGVLVLVGQEISTRRGHFLAFGLEHEIDHRGLTEREICAEVTARGGFGFAAHPFSRGSRMSTRIGRPHPWADVVGCDDCGVELWSLVTDSAERWASPWQALSFLRRPERSLCGPPVDHLARWDALCARRRVPAIGGLDAHQTGMRVLGRTVSPMRHETYFRMLRTHVLLDHACTGDLEHDRDAVYDALRQGRCYLGLDVLGPTSGFEFRALGPEGELVPMGAQTMLERDWTLHARSPRPARIRLLRDGAVVAERRSRELVQYVERPGAHRIEVALPAKPECRWIVSNPIYVRERA